MSQKSELVPKRRFKEFENAGDWEQCKFADFIDVKSGKDYKHLNSGPIPVYGTGGYMLSVDRALSDIDAIGIGRKGTIDKPYLLKAPFWTVDTLFYAVPKQNIDLQFSLSIFKKINWKKFDESTGVPSLSKTVINSVGASVPSYEEQQKIGSFFKQLDNTITLHQRKLDKLKNLKQSYLYQMFPQNGQKVPTLRFSGFIGDWGVHKLKDMASLVNGYAFKSENYVSNGIYKILTISNVTGQRYTDMNETNSVDYLPSNIQSYQILQQGDVLISLTGNVGRVSIVNEENCLLNQRVGLLKTNSNVNQEYIYQCLNNKKFEEKMIKSGQGAAQLNISKNDIEEYEILLPSKKEQQKIGKFFKQLDETIEVQEQELEKLKNLKEAYLNEMFV